jgi:stearoyl-CoA desaturase (Delta-9 desaturase)
VLFGGAEHGLGWWEIDPSALIIRGLEKTGLAWNLARIAPERQAARLAPAARRDTASHQVISRAG